jgi:phosphoserine phosphatase
MNKIFLTLFLLLTLSLHATDTLSSWNEGSSKQSIINYVTAVTKNGTADFIPIKDRIAVFDNDGTLWSERPVYFQLYFAMDRVRTLVSEHPEWKTIEPFKSVLANDMNGVMKSGEHGLVTLVNATHSGMDVETFKTEVRKWLKTAKHPTMNRPYTDLIYQPMREVIRYLEANDFKGYIVAGGGIDFMRSFVPAYHRFKW